MNTKPHTKNILKAAALSLVILTAPHLANAGDATSEAISESRAEMQYMASLGYKPMYVSNEPDGKETFKEIESQFQAAAVQKISDEEMSNLGLASDDDC